LLTSDEPVALHFRDRNRPPGHDRGIAYADEIWFPLDPRRLLILGRPGDPLPEQRLRPAAKTAVTVNRTIAAGAYEHIYMHPAQDHLKGLRLPKPVPSSRSAGTCPSISAGTTSPSPTPAPNAADKPYVHTVQVPGGPACLYEAHRKVFPTGVPPVAG
jgi:hypothetical protein